MRNSLKILEEMGSLGAQDPKTQKVGIINLGCARNLVDSQHILGKMKKAGHPIVDPQEADIVILNTCSFVEDAKRESIDAILDLIELKKQGKIKKIVVAGCLPERYKESLASEFQEVDTFMGVQALLKDQAPSEVSLTPEHFAYVKICESCYNHCGFCAIPMIKGPFVSRSQESVIAEVERLDTRGVREINIIGQDITAYGIDLYKKKSLAELLKRIVGTARNIEWVRLLYAFPAHITDELIDLIASEEKICKYIDVPLQHINDQLLKRMGRKFTAQQTRDLIAKIRQRIPGAVLRTSFIVGLPGETEKDFEELLRFVQEIRFEKLGVFMYSREEGTPAYGMPHQVPQKTKKQRLDLLMREQKKISQDIQESYIGRTLKVLLDEQQEGQEHFYVGRTEYDAPDVDGLVFVHSEKEQQPGNFVNVKITGTSEYDLSGEVI